MKTHRSAFRLRGFKRTATLLSMSATCLAVSFGSGLVLSAPALASYPVVDCGPQYDGVVITTADGEVWKCVQDPTLTAWYWAPVDDEEEDYSEASDFSWVWSDYGLVNVAIQSVTEQQAQQITGSDINSGMDLFENNVTGLPLAPGQMTVGGFLYHTDGSAPWALVGLSGWWTNGYSGSELTPTMKWGAQPAGPGYYDSYIYGFLNNDSTEGGGSWSGALYSAPTVGGLAVVKQPPAPPAPRKPPHIVFPRPGSATPVGSATQIVGGK